MAQRNEIVSEELPLSDTGQPIIKSLPQKEGKIKTITETGVTYVDGMRSQAELKQRRITIDSGHIGQVVELYPGTKLKIMLNRAANGQECPIIYCLGQVVLESNREYELEYADIPIEGWTIKDCAKINTDPTAETLCYPKGIKSQKSLMEVILKHSAIYQCPFATWRLEYPEDIQEKMDMEALEIREQSLIERKKAALDHLAEQQKKLDQERKRLVDKTKKSKVE